MNIDNHIKQKRIDDTRELYLKYEGRHHELIEKEMRLLGHHDFHRRILYSRFERGQHRAGWIERFEWTGLVQDGECGEVRAGAEPPFPTASGAGPDALSTASHRSTSPRSFNPAPITGPEGRLCRCCGPADSENSANSANSSDFEEFQDWLKRVSPAMTWDWKHQVYIYKRLRRVTTGECKRLMIFLPPRHGKSELVTVRYAAWRLKKEPLMSIIVGSYNERHARKFSRKIRNVLLDDEFLEHGRDENQEMVPAVNHLGNVPNGDRRTQADRSVRPPVCPPVSVFGNYTRRRANSEAEWETAYGGGLRAVGVGCGVTGYGAGLIIIDDPVKNRAEAESENQRDKVWDWFNDDVYTRLEPNGAIVLIQTRWHEDDLAGRLLREMNEEGGEQWDVVNLPALAEAQSSSFSLSPSPAEEQAEACTLNADPLGRIPGEALWPERYDEAAFERLRRKLGSYSFAALYQQRPVPAEGGLFKRGWFKIVSCAPPGLKWKRGYDAGISTNSGSDYTASLRVAFDRDENMYIDAGFRARIEYPELRRYILGRILAEPDTEHGIELSANGNAVLQDLRREPGVRGRAFRGVPVKGDKITRALPWIALAEDARVFLVRGAWNTEFIEEACSFPQGSHDDQIDAVSIAVQMHKEKSSRLYTF